MSVVAHLLSLNNSLLDVYSAPSLIVDERVGLHADSAGYAYSSHGYLPELLWVVERPFPIRRLAFLPRLVSD